MDRTQHLEALIAPLRADTVSGAAVVGRLAAEVVRRAAVRVDAGSPEELRWAMAEVVVKVMEAQPAMAPLVSLARDVLFALDDAADVEAGRHQAAQAAQAFRSELDARARAVASRAASLLPEGGTVATVSSSSTVKAALLHAAESRELRVLCLESRPLNEGQLLAASLSKAGLSVVYAVDAAAATLLPDCHAVLLGADSIGDGGVVNKIGSAALAEPAHRLGLPVFVLSDETKILPPGFPQHLRDDRPGEEVWRAPAAGVRVWNRYFETVPLAWVTSVVTESATLTVAELEEHRRRIRVPGALADWMSAHAPGPQEG
jgi:translation initiation factor 2B subunit (eIF-2B alpha/beta/delta family)